jgi:hypothetical protein
MLVLALGFGLGVMALTQAALYDVRPEHAGAPGPPLPGSQPSPTTRRRCWTHRRDRSPAIAAAIQTARCGATAAATPRARRDPCAESSGPMHVDMCFATHLRPSSDPVLSPIEEVFNPLLDLISAPDPHPARNSHPRPSVPRDSRSRPSATHLLHSRSDFVRRNRVPCAHSGTLLAGSSF